MVEQSLGLWASSAAGGPDNLYIESEVWARYRQYFYLHYCLSISAKSRVL